MEWIWMMIASALVGVIVVVVVKRGFKALPTPAKGIVIAVALVVVALAFPHLFSLEGAKALADDGAAQLSSWGLSAIGVGAGALAGILFG